MSSLQRTDSDLKLQNETLQQANNELNETKLELGDSNDSLQEALQVVQDMSAQNEARAKELEEATHSLDQSKKEADAIFDSVSHGLCLIDEQFMKTPFYGVRQMTWHLRNTKHLVNEKRIRRLMRLM